MSITPKKPVNYLNNKDILKEIHESKNSYCYFTKKEYHRYDIIIDKPDESLENSLALIFKPENIQQAKETRAARLSIELGEKIDPATILDTDLVLSLIHI